MSRKNQKTAIGRSVIKDRFGKKKPKCNDTFLHTSQLDDGYDWGRLNLQSVTEQSNLEDFLATAELAGTEFTAEKLNVKFVDPRDTGLPTKDQEQELKTLHQQHQNQLRVPRRPHWDDHTSANELERLEKENFLDRRRTLASLQEVEGIVLTPYEKNLDFWRQLWRVVERSDIIIQIVDARNPLLFRCNDLEEYVDEFGSKVNLLLINKADFLTAKQRSVWAEHFTKAGVKAAFWSAVAETNRQNEDKDEHVEDVAETQRSDSSAESDSEDSQNDHLVLRTETTDNQEKTCAGGSSDQESCNNINDDELANSTYVSTEHAEYSKNDLTEELSNLLSVEKEATECDTNQEDCCSQSVVSDNGSSEAAHNAMCAGKNNDSVPQTCDDGENVEHWTNSSAVLSGPELLELFRTLHTGKKHQPGVLTVGMVGYPNVGKSSTINAILQMKKVPVSATPGRTKHFQTLYVDSGLMLCDCPGLVFPSFVSTKADLIVNGILPIDQMTDSNSPISLICSHIPRDLLQQIYGITIPKPQEGEDPDRSPTAYELLNSYGYMRGFMTANGMPDCSRSARYVLKDYVNGRLLYCHPPPDTNPVEFHEEKMPVKCGGSATSGDTKTSSKGTQPARSKIDKEFFKKIESGIHSRGVHGVSGYARTSGSMHISSSRGMEMENSPNSSMQSLSDKPWKKHNNRKKKEKLRRVYNNDSD
ncbi:hypothetical protein ScPMuIL_008749 [Solemya velum]